MSLGFFYCFFSIRMLRCQAIQLICEFIASKNRSSIKAFHLYSERSFFSLFMRGISIFYFKFSTIRINTEATCALVVFAFGAKLPSVLPVINGLFSRPYYSVLCITEILFVILYKMCLLLVVMSYPLNAA